MVYKSVISDIGTKFATVGNASTGEIKVANTLINQLKELTFNFAGKIGEPSSTGNLLYPNPTHNELTISCNNLNLLKSEFSIYNVFGICVKSVFLNNLNTTVHLQDLSKGVYFLHTKTGEIISFPK